MPEPAYVLPPLRPASRSDSRRACEDALFKRLCAALMQREPLTLAQFRSLESIANRHSVQALLRDRLLTGSAQSCDTAGAGSRALTDMALREAALEVQRNETLRHIITALAHAGVPTLIFKGTALAHSHYRRPELRERDDTDLAVDPAHLQVAGQVLERLGFHAVAANEGSLIMRQRLYRRRDTHGLMHNIDLHWAISNSARTARLSVRELLARSLSLTVLGMHARMPHDIDAFLIACAHLDAHHVHDVRLIWLFDIHLMIANMPIPMRVSATERAIAYGIAPACGWVLATLERSLGSSLIGFEPLTVPGNVAPPSERRALQWQRELLAMKDGRTRMLWLWQHVFPHAQYLRTSKDTERSLWRLYLARCLRGVTHFTH